MIKNVADALELSEDQVNIKATTEEGLGFTGTLQGISSQAICCIQTGTGLTKKRESYKIIQTKRSQVLWPFFLYGKLQRTFHL